MHDLARVAMPVESVYSSMHTPGIYLHEGRLDGSCIKIHGNSMRSCDLDCSLIYIFTPTRSDYIQQRPLIVDVYHLN
jgi:hypothetical protein